MRFTIFLEEYLQFGSITINGYCFPNNHLTILIFWNHLERFEADAWFCI